VLEILAQLAPIFLYFGLGLVLKSTGLADRGHGEFMLRLVLMVTLPLMILSTVSGIPLTPAKAVLPLANMAVNFACMLTALVFIRLMRIDRRHAGTMLVNSMIMNNTYMFPFILVIYGGAGFADAILFDVGNAFLMSTVVYALAFRYGGETHSNLAMLVKLCKSPLLWSVLIAIMLSISGLKVPEPVLTVINPLARMTAPLILMALGIHFSFKIAEVKLVSLTVFIRMGMGLLFGLGIGHVLGLTGTTLIVVSLCSGSPVGFNALTFSSMAKLDTALSASAVSVSILAGLVFIPVLMLIFGTP